MIGSTAWRALMRRNLLYRRRNWMGTTLEVILPLCFLAILIAIKNAVENTDDFAAKKYEAVFPESIDAFQPLTFRDYETALQAQRVCLFDETMYRFSISGMPQQSYNWQIPMIGCDSRNCRYQGQNATDFCEYAILAVAGDPLSQRSQDRARSFQQWVETKYPVVASMGLVKLFNSSAEMDDYIKEKHYGEIDKPKIAMGVVWEDNNPQVGDDDDFALQYNYRLRQNSTNINARETEWRPAVQTTPDTTKLFHSYAKNDNDTCIPEDGTGDQGYYKESCTGWYLYNGVLTFGRLVNDFILEETGAKAAGYGVSEAGVQFVPFPTPAYEESGFYGEIGESAALLVTLGLLYPVAAMIRYITREKEHGQKELLKTMSATESDIGWSWFVSFFGLHIVTATLTALVSSRLYENSDLIYLWIFWVFTFLAVVVFCMFVSTFSSKSVRAIMIGLLIFFAGIFLPFAVNFEDGNKTTIALISLHPVAAFSYGIQELGHLEDEGVGLKSSTVGDTDNKSGYTFNKSIQAMIIDSLVWGVLTWYLGRVIPPDFGQALPWWFPFSRSYWFPQTIRSSLTEEDVMEEETLRSSIPFERVDETLERQSQNGENIEIHRLRKNFGKTIALDGLTMKIYKNHITALLGHNGAGKTTAINILTGALSPSGGTAKVAGKDIRSQMQQIRKDLGVCPQHSCLFAELTVREHVAFFARLKGVYNRESYTEAEEGVDQAIRDIALSEKRDTLAKNLSGGMQRKLNVACAFSGGNKIVLLDEPTSGMDPFSRRFTWNVIRKYRQDRCIILTTHFMDEADILGDRIGILSQGVLCCMGSPLFLKRAYGVGYQLTVEKARNPTKKKPMSEMAVLDEEQVSDNSTEDSTEDSANIDEAIRHIISSAVPRAQRLTNSTTAMSWQLPLGEASKFAPMFDSLDAEVEAGTISSWGISVTTIDEVFLAVARGAADRAGEKAEFASSRFHLGDMLADEESTAPSVASRMNLEKEGMFMRHLGALFKKRAAVFRRDKKAWTCTAILPSIFVFVGFLSIHLVDLGRDLDPLVLSLDDYNVKISGNDYRNPIPFNKPGTPYTCQPGRCAYEHEALNAYDNYTFCGGDARLQGNPACSISDSSQIIDHIRAAEAFPQGADVSSVSTSSHFLAESSEKYTASRYGAIFFTHESQSVLDDSPVLYAENVVEKCLNGSSDYWNSSHCNDFAGVGYLISYNFTALHAAPLYQVLADEALVRQALNESSFNIQCTINPLPITKVESNYTEADKSFYAWFLVVLSFPFIIGNFSVFVVAERESKAKHLQTVAGVEPSSYWLSTFLWDILNYQIPLWITVALMFIFDAEIFTTSERGVVGGVITLLILFGPAAASFSYSISFAFKTPSMANLMIIISSFLLGMGGAITVVLMHILGEGHNRDDPNQTLLDVANIITWILRFFPPFCLAKGLYNTLYIEGFEFWEGEPITVWSEPIMLVEAIFLACEAVVYLLLAIYLDKWSSQTASIWQDVLDFVQLKWLFGRRDEAVRISASLLPDDEDVILEQERVLSGQANDDLIVTSQLTKVYDTGLVAVNSLSLAIPPGECFGLLGINGAGKTTTLAMLTAEFPPTSGDATIAGFSVTHQPEAIRRRVGYCPQFDAHFDNLTGREHVELYASIKGVPKNVIREAAAAKLAEVGLREVDADRLSAQYSGGMKRRLSLACALIGQPQIVFLDEASTGVDPVARREIWKVISDHVTGDKHLPASEKASIILTTHSMEECEALCPRLGIMANGRLRCLGSPQHLKNKFGQGYQIELKVKGVDRDDVDFSEIGTTIQHALGTTEDEEAAPPSSFDTVSLNLDQVLSALRSLTGDDYLASLVNQGYPAGYLIWKDATSPTGVSLDELSAFAATELRMKKVNDCMREWYRDCILRERQETKVRYEIGIEGVQISKIFGNIEQKKEDLQLADYGVSGTSLEHVFNTFAAEAERLK